MFMTDPDAVMRISPACLTHDAMEYIDLFLVQNLDFGTIDPVVTMTEEDLKKLVTKALLAGMAFEKEVHSE